MGPGGAPGHAEGPVPTSRRHGTRYGRGNAQEASSESTSKSNHHHARAGQRLGGAPSGATKENLLVAKAKGHLPRERRLAGRSDAAAADPANATNAPDAADAAAAVRPKVDGLPGGARPRRRCHANEEHRAHRARQAQDKAVVLQPLSAGDGEPTVHIHL